MNNQRLAWPLLVSLALGGTANDVRAQTGPVPPDLAQVTLEGLLNITITSPSRREQRADDTPAAVYVLTQDDIRRSGITTVPELFRLVPGMSVSRINANNFAISVRGFANLTSNKLLVMIDGRSIYNRAFSGGFWNSLDLLVEDIDRIEVIRGPGGAVWGANAVNGVINIITKVSAGLFHVGALSATHVPAYTRVDARLEFEVTKQLSVVANGRNLFERTHQENADPTNSLRATLVPRTGDVRLIWRS